MAPVRRRGERSTKKSSTTAGEEGKVVVAPIGRRGERSIKNSNAAGKRRNKTMSKGRPSVKIRDTSHSEEEPRQKKIAYLGRSLPVIRFTRMAYGRCPDQLECYICGVLDHHERFCPFNYIYGRFDGNDCRGECPPGPGQHSIASRAQRKLLRRFVRASNLPPDFMEWDLQDLFTRFGPLLVWDVPSYTNNICFCKTQNPMGFGVVVFKKRADGERAIDELNGCEVGGCKIRVDWVYPSCR